MSAGEAGAISGGDRLPWIEGLDNFAALRTLRWQAHVYGEVSQQLVDLATVHAGGLGRYSFLQGLEKEPMV